MESITYHRGSSEIELKNGTEGAKIYRNWHIPVRFPLQPRWYVPVFLKKWQQRIAATQYKNSIVAKIHLLLPKLKSKISNSTHTQFKIQNLISPIQHILNLKFKFPQTQ